MTTTNFLNIALSLRCLSFRRTANYAKMYASFLASRLTGKPHIWHTPTFISVEPANYCNLSCPECPVGNKSVRKKAALFATDTLRQLLDEIAPNLHIVNLYFQGEPLLSTHFCEMAVCAKQHNLYTICSTNAQLLTNQLAKDIVDSGLDKIIISVDGATQETYEQYRKNGSLQKAIDGIRFLDFWKKQLRSQTPLIEVQCLRLRTNEHEWETLRQLYKTWGGNLLTFKTAQFYDYANGNALMPEKSQYSRYAKQHDGTYQLKHKLHNHCLRLWSGAVVDAEGNVLPCCFDKHAKYKFGNIQRNNFSACWLSNKAFDFRERILTKRSETDICTNCTSR